MQGRNSPDAGSDDDNPDEPTGTGSGPVQAAEGEEGEDGQKKDPDQGAHGAGIDPCGGEEDRKGEGDQTGEGIGVDEGAVDAGASEFVEDDWIGDVDAIGLDDEVVFAEGQEFGRGDIGPAGLIPGDEHVAGDPELDGVLVDGLEPAEDGTGGEAEEQGLPSGLGGKDTHHEGGADGEQVGKREGGQVGIDRAEGADHLPSGPSGEGPDDPAGQVGLAESGQGAGVEKEGGDDSGKQDEADAHGPGAPDPFCE